MQAIKNAFALLPLRAGIGSFVTRSLFNSSSSVAAIARASVSAPPTGNSLFFGQRNFSQLCICPATPTISKLLQPQHNPIQISTRNIERCYFPRPNETKRIRKHGWKPRMSTKNGRRIIMRRILKGRYILSH